MSRPCANALLWSLILAGGALAQASVDYETPRPWLDGAPHPRPAIDEEEHIRVRRVFRRKDLLPPPFPHDKRPLPALEIQGREYIHLGKIVRYELLQILHPNRTRTILAKGEGEQIVESTVRDLNADGFRELFVGIAPAKTPRTRVYKVFAYNIDHETYILIHETGPLEGGRLRFLPKDGGPLRAKEWAVAVDDPNGARSSYRTTLYTMGLEKLVEVRSIEPRPLEPYDQILWSQEALGRGDYQ